MLKQATDEQINVTGISTVLLKSQSQQTCNMFTTFIRPSFSNHRKGAWLIVRVVGDGKTKLSRRKVNYHKSHQANGLVTTWKSYGLHTIDYVLRDRTSNISRRQIFDQVQNFILKAWDPHRGHV
jgi:hypothetical protein